MLKYHHIFVISIYFIFVSFCKANIDKRVINGQNAVKSEFPWIINMVNSPSSDHRCGGVIIDENWVLTAGHCVTEIRASDIQLIAGDHNRTDSDSAKQRRNVVEFIIHPKYTPNSQVNVTHDFALLRVSSPFQFTDSVKKINLPQTGSTIKDGTMTLAGWGYTDVANHVIPDILQKVNLKIIPTEECRQLYSFLEFTDQMFCGGDHDSSACNGDSGSGFVEVTVDPINNSVMHVLYGIVSFGKTDCTGGMEFPTIFGNVPSILDWIFQITEEQDFNSSKNVLTINFELLLYVAAISVNRYVS